MKTKIYEWMSSDQRESYSLYALDGGDIIEFEDWRIYDYYTPRRFRFPASCLPATEYGSLDKLGDLRLDCEYGNLPGGQWYHKGRWWSSESIRKIQKKVNHPEWTWFV